MGRAGPESPVEGDRNELWKPVPVCASVAMPVAKFGDKMQFLLVMRETESVMLTRVTPDGQKGNRRDKQGTLRKADINDADFEASD